MATIYYTATTLDGFLATPDNSLSWLFEVPGADDAEDSIPNFLAGVGALAMGSTTYEWLLDHEKLIDEPHKWREWYGDRPTWVFTHRDLPVVEDSGIQFTQEPVATVHTAMLSAAGERDVWLMGGGDLVGQFADESLARPNHRDSRSRHARRRRTTASARHQVGPSDARGRHEERSVRRADLCRECATGNLIARR